MIFIKKYLVPIITIILVIIGCIKINIYNTIALSPIGNTEDNFEMVSKEFGEDFSEFIKDKSPVKIYLGEEGDKTASIKVNENEIKLTAKNTFLKGLSPIIDFFKSGISNAVDKINKNTENNNGTENSIENNKQENNVDLNNTDVETNGNNLDENRSVQENNKEQRNNTLDNSSREENNNVQENKSELDNIVDDFLNNQSTENNQ